MMRMLLLGAWLALGLATGVPAEPAADHEKLVTRYFAVSPFWFSDAKKRPEPDPLLPPSRRSKKAPEGGNAKEYLEQLGVTFPPGASATYSAQASLLVIHNTLKNVNLTDLIFEGGCSGEIKSVRIETQLVELRSDLADQLEFGGSFADLSKKLGDGIKILYANGIVSKSGSLASAELGRAKRVLATHLQTPNKKPRSEPQETTLSIEPAIGPDGTTIQLHVDFSFVLAPEGGGSGKGLEAAEDLSAPAGRIVRAKSFTLPAAGAGQGARTYALLIRCEIVNPSGRSNPPAASKGEK